jgi:hypothetical protein
LSSEVERFEVSKWGEKSFIKFTGIEELCIEGI